MAAPVLEQATPSTFRHLDFAIEPFLKHDLQLRLDTDAQLCPSFVASQSCPSGAQCPLRHVQPSPLNFQPPPPLPQSAHARTVCKHWLRGLCKKGAQCEFMHEYHLRKMPECWFFAKYGFCSNGDECMYLHVTATMRVRECPKYRKGFCPDGPECELKHVRRVPCPDYLVGFCKKGRECELGHPFFDPAPPPPMSSTRIPDVSGARFLPEATFRLYRPDWLAHAADPTGRSGAGAANWGGGGGGGGAGGGGGGRRDMSQVICYKCNQPGHFANNCPNGPGGGGGGGPGGGGGAGGRRY
ncbi:hypothetical protein JCM10213_005360 [Rhodosporidiobolus nylandii]